MLYNNIDVDVTVKAIHIDKKKRGAVNA